MFNVSRFGRATMAAIAAFMATQEVKQRQAKAHRIGRGQLSIVTVHRRLHESRTYHYMAATPANTRPIGTRQQFRAAVRAQAKIDKVARPLRRVKHHTFA